MENYKTLKINFDITHLELGSLALGTNSVTGIELKVQGLLL
jgi:hypothetical protein